MRKLFLLLTAAAFAASPAIAKADKKPAPAPSPAPTSTLVLNGDCVGDFATATVACVGYQSKNVLNGSSGTDQISALKLLGFDTTGFDFNSYQKIDSNKGAFTVDFGKTLYGLTYVGVHFGNSSGAGNATGFYKFDAGSSGVKLLNLVEKASSGVVLYRTDTAPGFGGVPGGAVNPVPEPTTWALMIGGFGLVGGALRRRRRVASAATA